MPSVTSWLRSVWVCLLSASVFASACGDCGRAQQSASPVQPSTVGAKPAAPATSAEALTSPPAKAGPADDGVPIGCEAIPVGLVAELLGYAKLQLTDERIDGMATLCQYKAEAEQKFASVRVERGYDPDRFEASKQAFPNASDVAGYGDRAFMSSLPMMGPNTPYGIHSIAVLKGRTHMTISAPVPPEKIQLLARALLESL